MKNLWTLLIITIFLGTYSTFGQKGSNNASGEKEPKVSIEMSSTSTRDDGTMVNERNTEKIEYSMSTINNTVSGSESNQQPVNPAEVEVQISMKSIDSSNLKKTLFRKEH